MKINFPIISVMLALIAAFLIPCSASAQVVFVSDYWTAAGGNNYWSNPANWTLGVVGYPNNSSEFIYSATIGSGHTDSVVLDTGVTIYSLELGRTIAGPLSTLTLCDCVFDINGPLTVNKTGRLNSSDGGTRLKVTGDTTVDGRVNDSLGDMRFKALTNSGIISMYGSGTIPSNLTATSITNTGTVSVTGQTTLNCEGTYTQASGTTAIGGPAEPSNPLIPPAEIKAHTFSIGGGTIGGSGYIEGDVNVTGGRIAPTSSVLPSLVVKGDFRQENEKSDISETFGIDPPGYPFTTAPAAFLEVTGVAAVNGTLTVTEPSGYMPFLGQTTPVVVSDTSIGGTFSRLNLPALLSGETWQINYNAMYENHAAIVITVVVTE
jgi:hypothetical protein